MTAPLVYVNYGVPADYEGLERLGVDVRGKIVIARYGGGWRGIKPKVAAEHGAVGCIIYSDPRDDGFFQGEVYPKGPFRPEQGVQRGSVADMPVYSGDPLTPGIGAVEGAKRLDRKDAQTITKIPVLPISYGDAKPLLAALEGPVAPEGWRGALPITYHVGPGPAKVHLKLVFDWKLVPARDVIAKIEGSVWPDEWVIRGNHHDAWVNGAEDPISGLSALLEEARAMGALVERGWRPKRTIVFCAWDGEEEGLLGSTEWAETHAAELQSKAVAYINTDGNGRGFLNVGGSHSLDSVVNGAAAEVEDPEKKMTVLARARLKQIADAAKPEGRKTARDRAGLGIEALGSGSDFTPFLQHLGIASLNIGFGGEDGGGIYHSIYDSFSWYTRFADTDFTYARALAQTGGTMTLRLANADVLAMDFSVAARAIAEYVKEVEELADAKRLETEEKNRQLEREPALGSRRSEEALRRSEGRSAGAPLRLLAAAERLRLPDGRRGRLSAGLRHGVPARRAAHPARAPGRAERHAARIRAQPHVRGRAARASLVQALHLRARRLHGLRRQDAARRARAARAEALGRGQPRGRADRSGDREGGRAGAVGGEAAGGKLDRRFRSLVPRSLTLPRREPPPSLRSGDYSRRERMSRSGRISSRHGGEGTRARSFLSGTAAIRPRREKSPERGEGGGSRRGARRWGGVGRARRRAGRGAEAQTPERSGRYGATPPPRMRS